MTEPTTDQQARTAEPDVDHVIEPGPDTGLDTGSADAGWAAGESSADAGADDVQWRDLQARFVDEPESVTREAAVLVDQAVARLTQSLAAAGGDGSTENLRHAFRRYREVYRTLSDA